MDFESNYDPKAKMWTGQDNVPTFNQNASVGQIAIFMLKKFPKTNIVQISDSSGKRFTSSEIATLSIRVAQHLQKLGLKQKDIIGICASNTEYVTPLAIGAFAAGVVISTLDPSFDKDGIKHIYGITRPKLMFCDGKIYESVKQALAELKLDCPIYTMKHHKPGVRKIDELLQTTNTENLFEAVKLEDGGDQLGAILCSSGTTGLPKGVCVSHKSLAGCSSTMSLSPDDVMISFSTLYWLSGVLTMLNTITCGATRIVTDQPFTAELFLKIIEKYRVTAVFTPPSQMALTFKSPEFEKSDLSSLKLYFCGGSALPFPVFSKMREKIPQAQILSGYGMTEVFAAISAGTPTGPGDNGKIASNIRVKVIDDEGKNLGVGETGEICVKTNNKWAGYYKNPEATKEMYDADSWIHSGDLGYVDARGCLFIVDRKKDIMKYKNFHFSPTEIEQVISELPDVVEVCVCGIPDVIASDLPAAAVVTKRGSKITKEQVYAHVATKMTQFKHLRGGVFFMDKLPKTPSGKNLRRLVKNALLKKIEAGDVGISEDVISKFDKMSTNQNTPTIKNGS